MTGPVDAEFARSQLDAALPPEMPVYDVRLVDDRYPALMARLAYADYRITFDGDTASLFGAIPGYLAESEVIAMRKTKSGEKPADIRAMTESLTIQDEHVLCARLQLTEKATLKPDLLISVLAQRAAIDVPQYKIHRTALLGLRGAEFVELLDL